MSLSSIRSTSKSIRSNPREILNSVAKALNITKYDDWYSISKENLQLHGAKALLQKHGNSPARLITTVFRDDFEWKPWKFTRVYSNYWKERENVILYFEDLGKEIGISKLDDWYQVRFSDLTKNEGHGLLSRFQNSPSKALAFAYPDFHWKPYLFTKIEALYWLKNENVEQFLQDVSKELNMKTLDDWYQVTNNVIEQNGGRSLMKNHASVYELLLKYYPTHNWLPWKFDRVSTGYWQEKKNVLRFLDWVWKEKKLNLWEDWYEVTYEDLIRCGGRGLLFRYGDSVLNILMSAYPQYNWERKKWKFNTSASKSQTFLFNIMMRIFPLHDIYVSFDCREVMPELAADSNDKRRLEVDIAVPSIKLCIEYQGEQHYEINENGVYDDFNLLNKRDISKSKKIQASGFTLIEVPYWWNKEEKSLRATILQRRPDLLNIMNGNHDPSAEPIPPIPPLLPHHSNKTI